MSTPRSLSFQGCKSRSEVFARLTAFLNAREDEMILEFASRLNLDDDVSAEEFQSQIMQLRGYLAANRGRDRAELFAQVNTALDEAGRP